MNMDLWNPDQCPPPDLKGAYGRWTSHAEKILEETDALIRVAGITKRQVERFEAAGIQTMKGLAATTLDRIPKMSPATFEKLRDQAGLQVASAGKERPEYKILPPKPKDPRKGLALLPPPHPADIFFDMEGYPLAEGGLEYLFGATYYIENEMAFIAWWGHDAEQEKKAFEEFIDWTYARWRANPAMHVFHYAHYETTALKRLMGKYGTREEEVDNLLRNEVFVDLFAIVRNGIRVGTSGYSIKDLEPLYQQKRENEIKTGGESIVVYRRWINTQDPSILDDIRDYNKDDTDSTLRLRDWLLERQKDGKFEYLPPGEKKKVEEQEEKPQQTLARKLLDKPGQSDIGKLLGFLVEFHRREEKPMWWRMFDRHNNLTSEQLKEDLDCLGGLEKEDTPPVSIKKSTGFWYRFDPEQDTKLDAGSPCYFSHDLDVRCTIHEIDRNEGRVCIKLGPKPMAMFPTGDLPGELSIIPDEYIKPDPIPGAILELAEEWSKHGTLPPALEAFLLRRSPNLEGMEGIEDLAEGAIRVAHAMDGTTLCIQGPPGTGKTYTAAKMILSLLDKGKKVGVAANSHKAIENLLRTCAAMADWNLAFVKDFKGETGLFERCQGAIPARGNSQVAANIDNVNLFGGTAWLFSREDMAKKLDYLFVDEAGQVSLANLVAMSRSAQNLVLVGDQMQLGQPIQGSHPGESGQSALEYYLEDHQTIPADKGIFLGKSWRLHPDVCRFISDAFYEGRLFPEKHTKEQAIRGAGKLVNREAGILFLPVEHEDNVQGSEEEVEAIQAVVKELIGREFRAKDGTTREISLEDILVVAPYNMQVRALRRALGNDARVGSVDRFQGQEAPVVIVSMCASDGDSGPRGLEFLMSPNRLNVALSRAMALAIVVGNPALARADAGTVEKMKLLNTFARLLRY